MHISTDCIFIYSEKSTKKMYSTSTQLTYLKRITHLRKLKNIVYKIKESRHSVLSKLFIFILFLNIKNYFIDIPFPTYI